MFWSCLPVKFHTISCSTFLFSPDTLYYDLSLVWKSMLLEKAMAPHSSTLAWKVPWMEEPGRLRVHGVAKSRTQLSDFTFTFSFHASEKEMAAHSSVLAWRFAGTGEPGGLPSMGSHRVGHDWSDLAAAASDGKQKHVFVFVFFVFLFLKEVSLLPVWKCIFVTRSLGRVLCSQFQPIVFWKAQFLLYAVRKGASDLLSHLEFKTDTPSNTELGIQD